MALLFAWWNNRIFILTICHLHVIITYRSTSQIDVAVKLIKTSDTYVSVTYFYVLASSLIFFHIFSLSNGLFNSNVLCVRLYASITKKNFFSVELLVYLECIGFGYLIISDVCIFLVIHTFFLFTLTSSYSKATNLSDSMTYVTNTFIIRHY